MMRDNMMRDNMMRLVLWKERIREDELRSES